MARSTALSRLRNAHYAPAIIVCVIVVLSLIFADHQKRTIAKENLRAEVTEKLSLIRARVEGGINGNIQLVQGMVATVEADLEHADEQFKRIAPHLLESGSQLRNVALAPSLVVSAIYPLKGNEKAIGLDYRINEKQRAAAFRVRETRKLQVTGPVDLVQGGRGLIVRYPVETQGHNPRLWGIISAVIDLEKLYKDSGLLERTLPIEVAIAGNETTGRFDTPFFGNSGIVNDNPVNMTIHLGQELWQISAVPDEGWDKLPDDIWWFRLASVGVGLMVLLPMVYAGRLMNERARNIGVLQAREGQLNALSYRLELALASSKIGVWEFDIETGALLWDQRMKELYGVPAGQVVCNYDDWKNALHPEDIEEAQRCFASTFAIDSTYISEFRLLLADGEVRHIRTIGRSYRDAAGNVKVVGVNWNVTADIELQNELRDAKRISEEHINQLEQAHILMEFNALHDSLTSLPNRRYLDQVISRMNERGDPLKPLTILHVDLDRFKEINDTLGHAAGDEILRRTGAILTAAVPARDFVARIGGDEFVILSEQPDDGHYFARLAEQIIADLNVPMMFEGHECRAGASLGIASLNAECKTAEQLLINADIALYEAKTQGRNRFEVFTDSLRLSIVNTRLLADEILRGLEANEFLAYFQPQFDARTLEMTGVEALVRWDHPTRGILAPDSFLKVAEDLNVVARIDQLVLEHALFQFQTWNANNLSIPAVSVNISTQRLHDQDLFDKLDALNIQPGMLCFELLESISFDGQEDTLIETIQKIKRLGIDIEIDDFGTGYASIVSLLKLTPRRLKIDRQFISPMLTSPTERQLVASIIDIAKTCGIEVVAEGVETMAHATALRDLGCDILQGYAFARPMSPRDFLTFTRERAWFDIAGDAMVVALQQSA